MDVVASAPGKLVWLGEYAVLERGPAVVMAVNRRARVRLVDAEAGAARKPNGEGNGADDAWHAGPQVVAAVAHALDCDSGAVTAGLRAEVDASALFAAGGEGRVKLGLGSSAALIVAMAGAVCALQGRALPGVEALIGAHRRGQRGRGSGVDVAAAVHGGVSVYRVDGSVRRQPVDLPPRLRWCCVWSGRPASTGELLARMEAWRARSSRQHAAAMNALVAVAESGVAAIEHGDADALVAAVAEYGRQLASLSEASGVDIVCREHRAIGDTARQCGVAYKSCGAGGGDVGVAMTTDARALAEFRRRVAREGWQLVDLAADTHGLETRLSV